MCILPMSIDSQNLVLISFLVPELLSIGHENVKISYLVHITLIVLVVWLCTQNSASIVLFD